MVVVYFKDRYQLAAAYLSASEAAPKEKYGVSKRKMVMAKD